ncbi:hypothetical protein J2W96_007732 [Variovorax guangxiensis]|nr:hypothetical protein [Variovorax guangxiensis]
MSGMGRGRVETALTSEYAEGAAVWGVIVATESSSGLIARTRGWSDRESLGNLQRAVKEAHAPTSLTAFIVLAIPRIASPLFLL